METLFVSPERARRPRRARLLAVLAVVAAGWGCAERLDGGQVCPALCPEQPLTTAEIDVAADSLGEPTVSIAGFPPRGTEPTLLLAARGDTLDARAVIRYDSLPATFIVPSTGQPDSVRAIDSVSLRLVFDTTVAQLGLPLTFEVYDVDTIAADTNDAAVIARFRPDRLVGSRVLPAVPADTARKLRDSLSIPIDPAYVLGRIRSQGRVRLGVRVLGAGSSSAQIGVFSDENSSTFLPMLRYDPSPDTATKVQQFAPRSGTPVDNALVAFDLSDYPVVVTSPAGPPSDVFRLGGYPGRRALVRFRLPRSLVDSAAVIRATLLLTQLPSTSPEQDSTIRVQALPTIARERAVSDPAKVALLVAEPPLSVAATTPGSSGEMRVELGVLVRSWAGTDSLSVPRVAVLRADPQAGPREVWFYGGNAAPSLRPRLLITYIPQAEVGTP